MLDVNSTYTNLASDSESVKEFRIKIANKDGTSQTTYAQSYIKEMTITRNVFKEDKPCVGGALCATLDATLRLSRSAIPTMAQIVVEFRLVKGSTYSDWYPLGTFYVDTKSQDYLSEDTVICAYDSMMKAQIKYPITTSWENRTDVTVLNDIATAMGVQIDARTTAIMTNAYNILYPGTTYNCREVLGYLGAMYAGNFIMSNENKLLLIRLNNLPTNVIDLLIDEDGDTISFGSTQTKIIV